MFYLYTFFYRKLTILVHCRLKHLWWRRWYVRDVPPSRALQFRVYICVNSSPFFLRPLAFSKFPLLAILYLLCTLWLVRLTIFCDLLAHLARHSFHSSLCSHLIDFFLSTDFSFLTSFIMLIYFLTWSCYVFLCLLVAFLPSQQLVDLHFVSLVFFT